MVEVQIFEVLGGNYGTYLHLITPNDIKEHLMSSNLEIKKVCQFCGNVFTAKTTVTKYCSHDCNRKDYKRKLKAERVQIVNKETSAKIAQPIEQVQAKEILSVKEVSILLGCSVRTIYRLIENGTLKSVKLSERLTRINKKDLSGLLNTEI